jgi:hypothetical protein
VVVIRNSKKRPNGLVLPSILSLQPADYARSLSFGILYSEVVEGGKSVNLDSYNWASRLIRYTDSLELKWKGEAGVSIAIIRARFACHNVL